MRLNFLVFHLIVLISLTSGMSTGGTKWNPQTEAKHNIYMVARFDPCGSSTIPETESSSQRSSPDAICKSALLSYDRLHWTERTRCLHATSAACRKNKCTVKVPKKFLNCFPCEVTTSFSQCAKDIVKEHGDFLKAEVKETQENMTAQRKGKAVAGTSRATNAPWTKTCGCSHCSKCPLQPVGCPYCPVNPRKVRADPVDPHVLKQWSDRMHGMSQDDLLYSLYPDKFPKPRPDPKTYSGFDNPIFYENHGL